MHYCEGAGPSADPGPAAETTQPSSTVSATPRTLTPEPGDHFVSFACPPTATPPLTANEPHEVRKSLIKCQAKTRLRRRLGYGNHTRPITNADRCLHRRPGRRGDSIQYGEVQPGEAVGDAPCFPALCSVSRRLTRSTTLKKRSRAPTADESPTVDCGHNC
jgi:hypothetical protein